VYKHPPDTTGMHIPRTCHFNLWERATPVQWRGVALRGRFDLNGKHEEESEARGKIPRFGVSRNRDGVYHAKSTCACKKKQLPDIEFDRPSKDLREATFLCAEIHPGSARGRRGARWCLVTPRRAGGVSVFVFSARR